MRSISWRLTFWYAAVLAAILIIAGGTAYTSMRYLLITSAEQDLQKAISVIETQAAAAEARELINDDEESAESAQAQEDDDESDDIVNNPANHPDTDVEGTAIDIEEDNLSWTTDSEPIWVQITDGKGTILKKSKSLGERKLPLLYVGPPKLMQVNNHWVSLAGVQIVSGEFVQVARPWDREEEFLHKMLRIFGLLFLGGLLFALCGGWLITRLALKPIQGIIRTARQISSEDLSRRIELPRSRNELFLLAETFNKMLDRLDQGFKAQEDFVAAASHDLRTPLTVIKSYTDLLKRWGKNDPVVAEESVLAISKAVNNMERLINDLLLLARAKSGFPLKKSRLSLSTLLEEIVQESQLIAGKVSVVLTLSGDIWLEGDEHYLRRAFWAIIDNGIKYNRPDGRVVVTAGIEKGQVKVIISDTGLGIPAESLPLIFNRFYRGDQSRSQGQGFGLGLALAKSIIEAHGGTIHVSSHPETGTTFTILI